MALLAINKVKIFRLLQKISISNQQKIQIKSFFLSFFIELMHKRVSQTINKSACNKGFTIPMDSNPAYMTAYSFENPINAYEMLFVITK